MLNLDHDTIGYKLKVCSNTCGQVRLHTLFLWQPREDCLRQKRRRFLSSNFINQYFLCTCRAGVTWACCRRRVQILFRYCSGVCPTLGLEDTQQPDTTSPIFCSGRIKSAQLTEIAYKGQQRRTRLCLSWLPFISVSYLLQMFHTC